MAKDYLSCPGELFFIYLPHETYNIYFVKCSATSINVERLFSFSGKVVSPLRTHLNDESIQATVLLNSWLTFPELDVRRDFEERLVKGWKRGQNKEDKEDRDVAK
jgi:hypothetical protein